MKFGAICCLYDDIEYLDVFLHPIVNHLNEILFLISDVNWKKEKTNNSRTLEKIKELKSKYSNITLIQKYWDNEVDQRNFGLFYFYKKKFEYSFIIDTDEIYKEQHFKNIIKFIKSNPKISAFHIEWNTYWKKEYYRINPRENFKPVIVVKTNSFLFIRERQGTTSIIRNEKAILKSDGDYNGILIPSKIAICYHLSYARDDDFIRKKIGIYKYILNIVPDWYEDIWLKWTPKMTNLHPVTPPQYQIAIKEDLLNFPIQLISFIKNERLSKRKCSIVILNWNSCDLLKRCIELIKKHTKREYEIIVVDNGSTKDDSVEFIKSLDCKMIYNEKNLGFSGGINSALRYLKDSDVCLLNVDAEVTEEWLESMYKTLKNNPFCGLVSSKGNEVEPWNSMFKEINNDMEVSVCPAYCLLIMKEVIDKIGWLDPIYEVGGYEDNDYCLRAQLAGYSVMISHNSFVKHKADHPVFKKNDLDVFENQEKNKKKFNDKIANILLGYRRFYDFYKNEEIAKHFGLKIKQ